MPSRGNLVAECARVIRLRLTDGEWRGFLPGERRMAEILQVGRDTVRLALQLLEREQILSLAAAGSRRQILQTPDLADGIRERPLRIGMLSPRRLEHLSQPTLFEVDHIRRALAEKGGSLDLFSPSWYEQKEPAKRLAQLVESEPCSAWILFRSSEQIQRWFMKSAVPCLIRGYPHPKISLPHVDVDWEATARHAAGKLWRLGHRRVGILVPSEPLRGVAAAIKGTLELGEADFSAFEMPENGTVEGVIRALSRALHLRNPPTAVITTRPRQVATAMTWLASQGILVPTGFSVISIAYEPFLDHLVPAVTCYRVDPEAVSKQVLRRIESIIAGNPSPGGNSWITPEVVKGASIGPLR